MTTWAVFVIYSKITGCCAVALTLLLDAMAWTVYGQSVKRLSENNEPRFRVKDLEYERKLEL